MTKTWGQSAGKTCDNTRILRDYTFGDFSMNLEVQWIVGFVDGEGCFHVAINNNQATKSGIQIQPEFSVVQHQQDIQILYALKKYFQCGQVGQNHGERYMFRVRGQENLRDRILPFFEKHKLKTKKRIDFEKFRDVVRMVEKGDRLTEDGVKKIRAIQKTMNRKREKSKI